MRYQDLVSEFEVDGFLRDIYAFNTTVDDWTRLLRLSSRLGSSAYFRDGEEAPLPSAADAIVGDTDHSHLLQFDLGGLFIDTHFYVAHEMEFDLDPREITSQADLDLVLDFCASIGQDIKRDIVMTPENLPEVIYLRYLADQDEWQRPERP